MKSGIAILSLALVATASHARPFKEMCEQFEPLRKLSDLKYVKPRIVVESSAAGVKPQDIVFTLDAKAGPIRFSPGPDGEVSLPFSDSLCAENPNIEINQPKGTMSISISIDPKIPAVRTLDYRLLDALRREWDVAISRQSLMWRLLAPSAKSYQVVFDPASNATAEVRLAAGIRKLTANDKGVLRIPFEEAWIAANPAIVLSEMPRRIGLAFD